jgi:methionyl-tRNA formyltransferase
MAPQHWPIINREHEAGITVHYVDETADTGNIIVQHRFPIDETIYVSDLQRIWLKYYKTIMVEAINAILEGKPTKEQKSLNGRYYGKLKKEQCVINKNDSVQDAYSLIRGVSLPYFGAMYDDKIIYRAHIREENESCDEAKVLHFSDGDLVIDSYKMQE